MNSLKKNLKILLIPNLISEYDLSQLNSIKETFLKFEIDSHIFNIDYSEENLKNFLMINKFNIIFAVNKSRPDWLSKKIRFISWFQDFYYNSDDKLESFLESDIVYFYASPESFGVKKKLNVSTQCCIQALIVIKKTQLLINLGIIIEKLTITKYLIFLFVAICQLHY